MYICYDLVLGFKWKKKWGDTPSVTLNIGADYVIAGREAEENVKSLQTNGQMTGDLKRLFELSAQLS